MSVQRVLLSINVRWWNAEAAYALNVALGLIQRGKQVWMIVNLNSPVHQKALEHGIPLVTDIDLDSSSLGDQWNNLKNLTRFIDTHKIEVINSFKSRGALLFTLLRKRRPQLVYIKTRGEARPPKNHFINRYLYGTKGCNGVITAGKKISHWLEEMKLGEQKIRTIYYGANPVGLDQNRPTDALRREFGIEGDQTVLALLGRTQAVKGHLILLEALNQLRELPIHLLFLVKDPEEFPEENQKIGDYLTRNNLKERVTILGFRRDLDQVLELVDMGVIPSLDSEVNCRVAVEFFSKAIPIITFPTGTLPEIIDHKKNGYVCDHLNSKALSEGIHWMFQNKTSFNQMKTLSKDKYLQCYTLDKLTDETLSFYESCLHA